MKGQGFGLGGSGNIITVGIRNTEVKTREFRHNVKCEVWDCLVFVNFVWHIDIQRTVHRDI